MVNRELSNAVKHTSASNTPNIEQRKMTLKYLITGATGGLGKHVLNYLIANHSPSEFAAASSNASNKSIFESRGIAFRHVNYDNPQSLETGLRDVENLFFVSTGDKNRVGQHARVVEAAKKAEVKHVCSVYGLVEIMILQEMDELTEPA